MKRTPDLSSVDTLIDMLPYHVWNELFLLREEKQQDKNKINELNQEVTRLKSERDNAISEKDQMKQTSNQKNEENAILKLDNKWLIDQLDTYKNLYERQNEDSKKINEMGDYSPR